MKLLPPNGRLQPRSATGTRKTRQSRSFGEVSAERNENVYSGADSSSRDEAGHRRKEQARQAKRLQAPSDPLDQALVAAKPKPLGFDGLSALLALPQAISSFDLDVSPAPALALPTALSRPAGRRGSLDELVVPVVKLHDERLLDSAGHSYLLGPIAVQTQCSTGRIAITFEQGKPTIRWAKQIPLASDGTLPAALRQEVDMMQQAGSPLLPHAILVGDGHAHLLMPNMSGEGLALFASLRQLTNFGPGGAHRALQVLFALSDKLLAQLKKMHANNMYHRDIKPQNLLFSTDSTITLSDFGSAHRGCAPSEGVASTNEYLAPFYFRTGSIEDPAKADVFAAGATLFALYTGHDPFLTEALAAYRAADKQGLSARDADFQAALQDYAAAWRSMHRYAERAAAGPLPDLGPARWTAAFAKLVARVPSLVPLIVRMIAPEAHLLPSADLALRALRLALKPQLRGSKAALPRALRELSQASTRRTTHTARILVENMNERLRARSPLFDELELENQPKVESIKEARAHIQRLAKEVPPKIATLPPIRGVKRIREMRVRVS